VYVIEGVPPGDNVALLKLSVKTVVCAKAGKTNNRLIATSIVKNTLALMNVVEMVERMVIGFSS